jgi:hypothetical protein
MTHTKDEALKLALEALELHGNQYPHMVKGYCLDAITAIKQALEAPMHESISNGCHIDIDTKFATWWHTEGSGMRPLPNEDIEEFAKRVTDIAWSNGEEVEREACAKVCDELRHPHGYNAESQDWADGSNHCAEAIRARGKA